MEILSIVIPLYNEEAVIGPLYERVKQVTSRLEMQFEILFVNDGSRDGTLDQLMRLAAEDNHIRILDLSRNFGHQIAITAGIDFANGDAVVVMDGDLQDPPELITGMLDLYRRGYDVVYAKRTRRKGESRFKRATAGLFYRLIHRLTSIDIPEDTGDFRLMSRPVVDSLRRMRERHRFVRGMVAWTGFRQTEILFERDARAAGKTKYSTGKMLRFAFDAIFSFSPIPLRVVTVFGLFNVLGGAIYLVYNLYKHFYLHLTVLGWTSLMSLQVCFSGALMVAIGVLGEYVARIFEEVKQRPLYIVRQAVNLDAASPQSRAVLPPERY